MRVGVFHPGAQHAWQRALAFQEAGTLGWYATSAQLAPDGAAARLAAQVPGAAGRRLRRELGRRTPAGVDPALLRRMGLAEWLEIALRRLGARRAAGAVNRTGNRRFARQVIGLARREPVDALWTHNGGALEAFVWARSHGLTCVLDQSIGHPAAENAVMAAERARHPAAFGPADRPHDAAWVARADAELALADRVLVGSAFAAESLYAYGVPAAKVRIVPYGYDETRFPDAPPLRPPLAGRPLELLFAGTLGWRKGGAHLLAALHRLPPGSARLTVAGRIDLPRSWLDGLGDRLRLLGQVPRGEMPAVLRAADALVLPSLFEGGGVVLYEARAAGLAILQSRACGDGVPVDVGEGPNGCVLREVTPDSLAAAIAGAAADPDRLARWQAASWRLRTERTWAAYRARLRALTAGEGPA
jgi:glycosyltransferase involved in cell wall biosynthesis